MTELLDTVWRDILYALRTMRRNRVFAMTAVLTLALGIGANTAMFTVIRSVLLKPLAYREPDRLVQLSRGATSARFEEMKEAARSYAGLGDYLNNTFDVTLSGSAGPEVLKGVSVSANFLNILEQEPLLGRSFRPEEDSAAGSRVAMISAELWRKQFGANPGILGSTVTMTAIPYTVIGVLPNGFSFPFPDVDVWITRPSAFVNATSPLLTVFGRLSPGVNLGQATLELSVLNQRYRTVHPGMLDGKSDNLERVVPVKERLVDNVRFLLWMLFGAIGLVLLIACANVASLLLARAASRSREFAVRAAVGASRSRIVRQLLAESVLLALAGGALGVALARWSLTGISRLTALNLPRAGEIQLDGMVLGFAVLLSVGAGVLFGLVPSLGASRPDLAGVLRASGEAAGSARRRRFASGLTARGALVAGQVALSIVLLIGAALLMQSLARLYSVNPGFNPSHLLTLHISLPFPRYGTGQKQAAFYDRLVERVEALPGVQNAAASFTLPFMSYPLTPVQLSNQPRLPLNQRPLAAIQDVTPAYFRTMEIPLRRGREFSARDGAADPLTAIVNEGLARVLWPAYPGGIDPVGQRILIGAQPDPVEVVGIVADMHQSLERNPSPGVYRPFDQYPLLSAAFTVRTSGDPLKLVHAVTEQVLAIDPGQPVSALKSMEDVMEAAEGQRRLLIVLLGCFAGAALLLAAIGLYGLIAYSVTQRRQEVGIRRALGARDSDILRLVIGQGLGLTFTGIALGLGAAVALTRLLSSLLFQTRAIEPATYAAVALLFVVVALAAAYIPARRAARVDPLAALRQE